MGHSNVATRISVIYYNREKSKTESLIDRTNEWKGAQGSKIFSNGKKKTVHFLPLACDFVFQGNNDGAMI